jgi:Outer membrane protein beta-barrel family/CarboxypepD_reg-like domain
MHKFLFIIPLFLLGFFVSGQSKLSLSGNLVDSSGHPLPQATVMLLMPKDSSLVNYGRSNESGHFEFKNVKRQNYILKVSYVSFLPLQMDIKPTEEVSMDLGNILLKPISKELFEVVVRTAKAPLSIRGDTIEYNAGSFKVPPGATVEDLLRKLPGMEIEADGSIRAQGQVVKKVTVDGRSFFGSDPKLATKNLSADAIQKVQVFNGQTEAAKVTGIDDGKKEKTINLELKESHKKGGFGKITAGLATEDRREIKGNYNKFDAKNQISVIGLGNNTNQSGMSFDDYQDFRGSQSFTWGDEADFGFSSGSRYISFDDGDDQLGIPIGGRRDGFSKNYSGGANYNFDTKKSKFSSNYYFNQSERIIDKISTTQRFFQEKTQNSADTTSQKTFSANHRMSLRYENNIDSSNTLILIGNGKLSFGNANESSRIFQQLLFQNTLLPRNSSLQNGAIQQSFTGQNTAIFRHKFAKKGRSFSASAGYNYLNSNGDATQKSLNKLFNATTLRDSILAIDQLTNNFSNKSQIKSSLFFVEPLSKTFFWESFFNTSYQSNQVNRDLFDRSTAGANNRNDSLSRFYDNHLTYNRLGSSIRYSKDGVNISAGLAAQHFNLVGDFRRSALSPNLANIDLAYFAWIPKFSMDLELKNNRYVFFNYDKSATEPNMRDLQPIVDNSNPLFLRVGNPNLLPSVNHSLSTGFNLFDAANFMHLYTNLSYNYNMNQVVYNQSINSNGIVTSKPMNISGGVSYNGYLGFGFPLKKTVSTMSVNADFNAAKNPLMLNDVFTNTQTNSGSISSRISYTPNERITLYVNASFGLTNSVYEQSALPEQSIRNDQFGSELNVNFGKNTFFSYNFDYRIFENKTRGLYQEMPILNLSVFKYVGKAQKSEIRLTLYDVFRKNLGVNQNAFQNLVSFEKTQTLSQYLMLSYTYNMRGLSSPIRKN